MKLSPTRSPAGTQAHRRGAAEVELLLILPVLFGLFWLIQGSYDLGSSRLANVSQAEANAYTLATTPSPAPAGANSASLDASAGFTPIMPSLPEQFPNRMHVAEADKTVVYAVNLPLKSTSLTDKAAFAGPAWAYSAWPAGDGSGFTDASTTQQWFSDYTAQVRDDTVSNALDLSPSSPP